MKTPVSIYALLVGIDNYPNPRHRLDGCVNDVEKIQAFLELHYQNNAFKLNTIQLINENASREAIIHGFEHFKSANDGDICLFYFAGHGSRCPAPEAFWHIEPDKMLESLVCHDSRQANGQDLADKELSYLIWEATNGKQVHFVTILDCCHSGTATRTQYAWPRQLRDREDVLPIAAFYGVENYKKSGAVNLTPLQGRHLLLAASKANETAKEVYIQGRRCGVFTHRLVNVLAKSRHQISYSELMNRVRLQVGNLVSDQSPQLESTHSEDKNLFFFSDTHSPENVPVYLVSFNEGEEVWTLNAGVLHGIEASDTVLEFLDTKEEVRLSKVHAHYSIVNLKADWDKGQVYRAIITKMPGAAVPLAFAEANDEEGEAILRQQLQKSSGKSFKVADSPTEAEYLIHAKYDHFFLTRLDEPVFDAGGQQDSLNKIRAVFKKIKGYSMLAANEFFKRLEFMNRWNTHLKSDNPNTTIGANELRLELFSVIEACNYDDDASIEALDWRQPALFNYKQHGAEWCLPAFQLKITNTGHRPLCFSMVFFGADYTINNTLMPAICLEPDQEAWALDRSGQTAYRTIPLSMDDAYHQWGITRIREYLKLFICTEEFSTDGFNQEGLPLDELEEKRSLVVVDREVVDRPDWRTMMIEVEIERPLDAKAVKGL